MSRPPQVLTSDSVVSIHLKELEDKLLKEAQEKNPSSPYREDSFYN